MEHPGGQRGHRRQLTLRGRSGRSGRFPARDTGAPAWSSDPPGHRHVRCAPGPSAAPPVPEPPAGHGDVMLRLGGTKVLTPVVGLGMVLGLVAIARWVRSCVDPTGDHLEVRRPGVAGRTSCPRSEGSAPRCRGPTPTPTPPSAARSPQPVRGVLSLPRVDVRAPRTTDSVRVRLPDLVGHGGRCVLHLGRPGASIGRGPPRVARRRPAGRRLRCAHRDDATHPWRAAEAVERGHARFRALPERGRQRARA